MAFNLKLTEQEITDMLNTKQKETIKIDYKKLIDSDNNEIAKDMTSFANADGGTIIYGFDELNWKLEDVCTNFNLLEEKFINIAYNNVSPSLTIYLYQLIVSGKRLFLIEIPKSYLAPHYVNSYHKFYVRCGSYNQPYSAIEMEEYEIEQRFKEKFIILSRSTNLIRSKLEFLWEKQADFFDRGFCFIAVPVFKPSNIKNIDKDFLDKNNIFVNNGMATFESIRINVRPETDFYGIYYKYSYGGTSTFLQFDYDGVISYKEYVDKSFPTFNLAKKILEFIVLVKNTYKLLNFDTSFRIILSLSNCREIAFDFPSQKTYFERMDGSLSTLRDNYIFDEVFIENIDRKSEVEPASDVLRHFSRWLNWKYELTDYDKILKEHYTRLFPQ